MSQQNDNFDQLPDALVERLARQTRAVPMLTPKVDRAISAAARAQFSARAGTLRSQSARPFGRRRRRMSYAAAAAVALVAFFVVRPFDQGIDGTDEQGRALLALANDIDGSGRVDVLDAFALARSRAADPGAVSADRLDELMRQIVAVDVTGGVL